ncbi:FtsK/SpoIIIE domain-containing protein [Microbacterium maritypicum]|uniref:FtsK domain-containing protein n=1 Tax=Microbacterium maritypicum MF109 TaxID=1333857 RepID=T5KF54_MICMQ|nr:FtsK/SpoIIIE domain-containing protein [Microbacterium liquefaciens]EQM74820.1 hypothetical protein L687_05005 [Microbacterium maritypicum MF109]
MRRTQIKVGPQFNPNSTRHVDELLERIEKRGGGKGWKVVDYDGTHVTLINRGVMHSVESATKRTKIINLGGEMRASDGEKTAAMLESNPKYEGWFLTRFEPHINRAVLSQLTEGERRCRSAVANALRVKPWDVQISPRDGGGFLLDLPESYTPSAHDAKLQEVAETAVGKVGWYFTGDAKSLRGEIVPSLPPTFADVIRYPADLLPRPAGGGIPPIPLGERLSDRGDVPNDVLTLDFDAAPHMQLGGVTGGGKSVTVNILIAGALAALAEMVIIDVPQKAVDFEAWRPFVRPGGWGCESFQENAVALEELYKEGERRAATLKRYGVKKMSQLPADIRATMHDVLIVVDELTGLFTMDSVPRRLAADDPLRIEAESKNYARELIRTFIEKIAAEQRFVGFHLVVSSQVATVNTGASVALRTNLPHKALLGSNASDQNRKNIHSDVTSIPGVPAHIKNDPKASMGVGTAEFSGQAACVFKSFYADEQELIDLLRARGNQGLPPTQLDQTRPDPSIVRKRFPELAQIAEHARELETPDYAAADANRPLEAWEIDPETGRPLTGFARANAARAEVTRVAKQAAPAPGM